MIKLTVACATALFMLNTANAQTAPTIDSKILLKTTSSWDGTPYTTYPKGQPELTVRKVVMSPGAQFDWHSHPMPAAGYVISGELIVEALEGGKTITLTAGQVLPEMNNIVHRGTSGATQTELVVFYAGMPGMPLAVDHNTTE
ncbi:MAG TPA: cupin domain-containing protein [Pseudomonas sp.]|uniref:cupin domain-containing protein n=1 Tax=Pseudomonas sp. TaxID=306 RepID=UPI002EDAB1E3